MNLVQQMVHTQHERSVWNNLNNCGKMEFPRMEIELYRKSKQIVLDEQSSPRILTWTAELDLSSHFILKFSS